MCVWGGVDVLALVTALAYGANMNRNKLERVRRITPLESRVGCVKLGVYPRGVQHGRVR